MVDYADKASTLTDVAALDAWLEKAITAVNELKLDGFAFTGHPLYSGTADELAAHKEKSRLIVSKLSAAAGQDKLLILEGDPAFVDDADLDKLDYIVLNTADLTNVTELKLQVAGVLANSNLPKEKLLLAARIGEYIMDEASVKQDAVTLMTDRVASLGPLSGLGIYNVGKDYYNSTMNYETTRMAIQLMNPSK